MIKVGMLLFVAPVAAGLMLPLLMLFVRQFGTAVFVGGVQVFLGAWFFIDGTNTYNDKLAAGFIMPAGFIISSIIILMVATVIWAKRSGGESEV